MSASRAAVACILFLPAGASAVEFKVAHDISLGLRTDEPSFVCLEHIAPLDRGRLAFVGRPVKDHASFYALDLATFETRKITVPGVSPVQVPPKTVMSMNKPLYYDTGNGVCGVLLRAGGLVSGEAELMEWDIGQNSEIRRVPLPRLDGAPYMSVNAIGYDHARRECFIETIRPLNPSGKPKGQRGHWEVTVTAVGATARMVACFQTVQRFGSKGPYFDPVNRRSAHVEYVEIGGETARTGVHIVDLDSGRVHAIELPRVIYGWDFDPDGRTGYAYSNTTGEVLRVGLEDGKVLKRRKVGRWGHGLGLVAPNVLLVLRNARLHFLRADNLREIDGLAPGEYHQGGPHVEGSVVMAGRALVRMSWHLYVIDFPRYAPGAGGAR